MKVLLVVIDAASPRVVCPAIQTGRLAEPQALLAEAGEMHQGVGHDLPVDHAGRDLVHHHGLLSRRARHRRRVMVRRGP